MKYIIPLLCLFLGYILGRSRHPLRSHAAYMRTEYPDLMAYVAVEEKIDMFLLKIENKPAN